MQKINLLYVITKLELGGAQKQLLNLINRLDRERFNIFLFTAKNGFLLKDALSINGLTIKKSRCLERPINPLKDFFALIEIYKYIKEHNIDIVHTHSSKAGILGRLAARLARARFIIHTIHGWSFNDYQPALCRIFFIWLERFTARFTDKLIVVSNYDKQSGLRNRIGEEGRYQVIHYGIDYTEFFKKDELIKEELGIGDNDLVVGMISCFKPQKSPQDFIKLAFLINQALPNVKFILVGDGILRKCVQKMINRLNLHKSIILTGWRRDIHRILSAIDIFVLTSLWEGLPIVTLEAMLASMPIVATDTGGIRDVVIDGQTGFLVAPGDVRGLSEKLILLLKDKNLRSAMSENAKNNLGFQFTLSNMLKDNQDLYNNLLIPDPKETVFC